MTRIQWTVFIIIVVAVVVGFGFAFVFSALAPGLEAGDVVRRLR